MATINRFTIKDVRCFAGEQSFEIRPLTFLVGENSTGKSTALGCFHALHSLTFLGNSRSVDFNISPYQMGAFVDIVREKKHEFELGFDLKFKTRMRYVATFAEREQGSEPIILKASLTFESGELLFLHTDEAPDRINSASPFLSRYKVKKEDDNKFSISVWSRELTMPHLFYIIRDFAEHDDDEGNLSNDEEGLVNLCQKISKEDFPVARALTLSFSYGMMSYGYYEHIDSFAPIRSKPQRAYRPLAENENPEGGETPVRLMNMSVKNKDKWNHMKKQLVAFGKASGLFTNIAVKKYGKSMSNPFDLQIKVQGKNANLVDVGYGVNQILPILVRIFNMETKANAKFLLQQPEVHLHPKGQAELTSLLISLIKQKQQSYIIETHSDYMIDRARIEIMQGNIRPDDVSLIYLEPANGAVKVHNVTFDKLGNFEGLPSSYGNFFLKEANKLMGAKD